MSTVRVKKAHDGHKVGDLISVPFGKGKNLVAVGLAEYPDQPAPAAPAGQSDALAAAQKRVKELEAENAELKKLVEAATAPAGKPAK